MAWGGAVPLGPSQPSHRTAARHHGVSRERVMGPPAGIAFFLECSTICRPHFQQDARAGKLRAPSGRAHRTNYLFGSARNSGPHGGAWCRSGGGTIHRRILGDEHCPGPFCGEAPSRPQSHRFPTKARELSSIRVYSRWEKSHVGISHRSASGRFSTRVSGRHKMQKMWTGSGTDSLWTS